MGLSGRGFETSFGTSVLHGSRKREQDVHYGITMHKYMRINFYFSWIIFEQFDHCAKHKPVACKMSKKIVLPCGL